MRLNKRKNKIFYDSIQNLHNLADFKKEIFYCGLCGSLRDLDITKHCSISCLRNKIEIEVSKLKNEEKR